jgi:hypothetical protein
MPDTTVEEAVERNCQAIMSGDLMRVLSDFTPEALTNVMSLGANLTSAMPMLHGYNVESHEEKGLDHLFVIKFITSAGDVTASATWREVDGFWRIVDIGLEGLPGAAAGAI